MSEHPCATAKGMLQQAGHRRMHLCVFKAPYTQARTLVSCAGECSVVRAVWSGRQGALSVCL